MTDEKFKKSLETVISIVERGEKDVAIEVLLELLYDEKGGDILYIMTSLLDRHKKASDKKINRMYRAVEDGIHLSADLGKNIITKDAPLKTAKYHFEGDNIGFLINMVKMYYPAMEKDGSSSLGAWFFDQFKNMVIENKEQYLDGSSTSWAKRNGHYEYIKAFIEKHDD